MKKFLLFTLLSAFPPLMSINAQSVVIDETVTVIEAEAFRGNETITEVTIPASVTTIEYDAFMHCSSLETVIFEEGSQLEEIGAWAFYMCTSLEEINLSAATNLTTIGDYAFAGCYSLETIEIPETVTYLGFDSFMSCISLSVVTIYAQEVPEMAEHSFRDIADNAILYVPEDADYSSLSDDFKKITTISDGEPESLIQDEEPESIKNITTSENIEISRYNLLGQRILGKTKGINIVKYPDGKVRKVMVK